MATRAGIHGLCVVLLLLGASASAHAQAQIQRVDVYAKDGWLACRVRASGLMDHRIESTVESGLPGACVYHVRLRYQDNGEIVSRPFELRLRLDVWNEQYVLESSLGEEIFLSLAAADSAWAHPAEIRLIEIDTVSPTRWLEVQADIFVSPLGADSRAWITDYVSQRSSGDRDEFSLDVGGLLRRFLGKGRKKGRAFVAPAFQANSVERVP